MECNGDGETLYVHAGVGEGGVLLLVEAVQGECFRLLGVQAYLPGPAVVVLVYGVGCRVGGCIGGGGEFSAFGKASPQVEHKPADGEKDDGEAKRPDGHEPAFPGGRRVPAVGLGLGVHGRLR